MYITLPITAAKCLDHNNRELKATTTATATRTAKNPWVYINKTTTLQVHLALQSSLHDCNKKLLNFMCPFHGVGKHNTKNFILFFLNLDTVFSDSTPENFANF